MLSQPVLYLLVGLFCTACTIFVIFLLMACQVGDVTSNAIGYAVGLVVSFVLNSTFTFRARMHIGSLTRFLLVALVAYLCNLATFFLANGLTGNSHLAQIAGMPVYTVVGFVLNKYWALARA